MGAEASEQSPPVLALGAAGCTGSDQTIGERLQVVGRSHVMAVDSPCLCCPHQPCCHCACEEAELCHRMGRFIRSSPINGRIAGAAPSHPWSQAERHTWLRAAVYPRTHSATAQQHLEGSAARRNRDSGRRFEFPERWTCERRDIITIL